MKEENLIQQDEQAKLKRAQKKKRKRAKTALLFALTGITAVVLIVESYAWFIGTGSIKTTDFEIGVSTEKSLFLSLDGKTWTENLTITQDTILGTADDETLGDDAHNAYEGNTNGWVGESGLVPLSTSGQIDDTASRLKLYGKSSITATTGGFRLISTRIDNYSADAETSELVAEKDGYVTFDLFIKNGEGVDYIPEYNDADDEAIYLTTDSSVTVSKAGTDNFEDYGLANSVRVAFVQIGRVASATTGKEQGKVTSIVCNPTIPEGEESTAEQTGLCEVKPVIWEPNDAAHNENLISYFSKVCKQKTKAEGSEVYTYSEDPCEALEATKAVSTYVVNDDITSTDNVDVYDGINGFEVPTEYKLENFDTFTDTEKILKNEARPAFFKLAANSITKIRVYIYLEGQDVDNYDLISLGEKIKINFGFTKDQFDLVTGNNEDEE